MAKGLIINPFTGQAMVDNAFCPTGQGGGVDPTCGPSGSRSTAGKGGKKGSVSKGQWVVHPQTGRRGVVSHTYDDNTNEKGRLVEVDYGNKKQNFRESELKKSKDQKSKWVDKTHEGVSKGSSAHADK